VGARLAYATSLPFPLLLLATGGITCVIGVLVGLPALRLSGLYLALVTLMFAGATTTMPRMTFALLMLCTARAKSARPVDTSATLTPWPARS
jgi:ABC-type branched-subunit amino acid transport system permease subunit